MARYSAFVHVVLTYECEPQKVVTKQFDNPNEFVSWVEDATESYNEQIGQVYGLDSYTIIEKVGRDILSVEHVAYDSRLNFQVRHSSNPFRDHIHGSSVEGRL